MPKRLLQRIWREEKGITGLETAIILIAFVVVAAVFAYTVLSAGLFSTQQSQQAVYSGLEEAQNALEIKGAVISEGLCELDDCEAVWTAAGNVAAAKDTTTYIEGTASANLTIAADFTTGVVGYYDITTGTNSLDVSGSANVSFWIKSSADIADSVLQLRLSESDDGTGTTENLAIPGSALDGSSWNKVTVDLSGTTANYDAVKSVALYAASDPEEAVIWLDIIETQPVMDTTDSPKAYGNKIVFTLSTALGTEAVDFTVTSDADNDGVINDESTKNHKMVISYSDGYQQVSDLAWTKTVTGKNDGDDLLENDEKFQITVDLSYINNNANADAQKVGVKNTFIIEVKPPKGAVLNMERTMPNKITTITNLH